MDELMSQEGIDLVWTTYGGYSEDFLRLVQTARAAHELNDENARLKEQLLAARAEERERCAKAIMRRNPLPTEEAIYDIIFKYYCSKELMQAAKEILELLKKEKL